MNRRAKEFQSLDELKGKMQFLDRKYWTVVDQVESPLLCRIVQTSHPKVVLSLVVKSNCAVHAFVNDIEINTLGHKKFLQKLKT